ncbi:MAG: hypothetical protein IJ461_04390 [Clostridia bacterium]|nr:hypothetical protein [Clostridia bacterium]
MNLDRAARYMGCPQPDQQLLALLHKAAAIVEEAAQPRHMLARLAKADITLPGEDVHKLLKNCDELFLMAATLGAGMDERIRRESLMDMALGLAVNACAASALEDYLNEIAFPLREGEYVTPRFSPGYGDLPLTVQTNFLARLNARAIGLYETAYHMLAPEKSVTALCGITALPQKQCIRKCRNCSNTACPFRE